MDLQKKIIDVHKMANETGLDFSDEIISLENKYQQIEREGKDVTIIAFSKMVGYALKAAEILEKEEGINAEVINPGSIRPLINGSVRKTNRLITMEEGFPQHGVGAEICACVVEDNFGYLDVGVERIAGADVPTPYAERQAFPQSLDEIKLLKFVNKHDPGDKYHLLRLYDYFYYGEHLLILYVNFLRQTYMNSISSIENLVGRFISRCQDCRQQLIDPHRDV